MEGLDPRRLPLLVSLLRYDPLRCLWYVTDQALANAGLDAHRPTPTTRAITLRPPTGETAP